MKKFMGIFAGAMIAAMVMTGCGSASAGTPAPNPTDPLISIHAEGGMCVYGGCSRDTVVLNNGSFTIKDGSGADISGQLDSASLDELTKAVNEADFEAIKSKPFNDVCPIAFDGQQYTFTVYRGGQTEVLDSCTYALDMESPLFRMDYQGTGE